VGYRSKKWWDNEVSAQLQQVKSATPAQYPEAAKALKKMIRRKERECWAKFLVDQGNRDPWDIVRIAKNPFGTRETMGEITDQDGTPITSQQDLVKAFEK